MASSLEIPVTHIALRLCIMVVVYFLRVGVEGCSISPPTVVCSGGAGCDIFNNQGLWEDRAPCRAATAVFPTTEAGLVAAVAGAVKNKQKINVVSGRAHSHNRLVCVGDGGLIISTRDYAATPVVNEASQTITVQAGVVIRDLLDEAAKVGLTFPTSTSWEGVTAAGSVSTGAHGSSLVGKGSVINEYVVAMRLVVPAPASEGYAKVIELTEKDEDLRAARFALGTLGVISTITFSLEPMFKRSVSLTLEDDAGLEDRLESFLRQYEFANIYWYIAHGKALMGQIDRVSVETPGDGLLKGSYGPTTVASLEAGTTTFEAIQASEDANKLCNSTGGNMNNRVLSGGGFLNDGNSFTGYPVVGFNHRMLTSGGCEKYHEKYDTDASCTPTQILDKNEPICSWDRRARGRLTFDLEIRVPLSQAPEAIKDLKNIRALNPQALCGLEGSGIVMRSLKKSETAYLSPAEDAVTFEIIYYRSRQAYVPTWDMDVYQEIEQLLIEKHGGALHWGKSGGYLFQGLAANTLNLQQFLAVKNRLDPDGLFSNEWTDGLLGIGGQNVEVWKEGCALEKLCKCQQDIHCDPKSGYLCQPGRVWTNARVCRKGALNSSYYP